MSLLNMYLFFIFIYYVRLQQLIFEFKKCIFFIYFLFFAMCSFVYSHVVYVPGHLCNINFSDQITK